MIEKEKREFSDIENTLKEVLKEDAPSTISECDRLREDLGMNSFNFMVMLYLLENKWGVRLKHDDMSSITTAGDLYRLLKEADTDEKVQ